MMTKNTNQVTGWYATVVDKLMELGLEASVKESDGILVIKIVLVGMDSLEQGNILLDRSFLS